MKIILFFCFFLLSALFFPVVARQNNVLRKIERTVYEQKNREAIELLAAVDRRLCTDTEKIELLDIWKIGIGSKAEEAYKKLQKFRPQKSDNELYLYLKIFISHSLGKSEEALSFFEFLDKKYSQSTHFQLINTQIANYLYAKKNPPPYRLEHLGANVNTDLNETAPLIDSKGRQLVFFRDKSSENALYDERKTGILHSDILADDRWNTAEEPVGKEHFSEKAKVQLYRPEKREIWLVDSGRLLVSRATEVGYKKPLPSDFQNVLPENIHSYCYLPEQNLLYFSAPSRSGDLDIYQLLFDRKTSEKAVRALEEVNSPADESFPFFSLEDSTLFFSSDRKETFGGFDIFASKKENARFQTPVNQGFPINSPANETGFSKSKQTAFFASDRAGSLGENDIYRLYYFDKIRLSGKVKDKSNKPLPDEVSIEFRHKETVFRSRPDADGNYSIELPFHQELKVNLFHENRSVYQEKKRLNVKPNAPTEMTRIYYADFYNSSENEEINFVVSDKLTGTFLPANLTFLDSETGQVLSEHQIEAGGSDFPAPAAVFRCEVRAKNYLYESRLLSTEDKEAEFQLESLKKDKIFVLKNIYFDTNSDVLQPGSFQELLLLAQMMKEYPEIKIEISGHTDNVGDEEVNRILSEKRAKSVGNFLISKTINAQRLRFVGYGETKPIASNDDEEDGKELNRRIEIRILQL